MFNNSTMIIENSNDDVSTNALPFAKRGLGAVPILISFSGGRSSALMLRMLTQQCKSLNDYIILFANTGKERPETLEFVHEIETKWNLPINWIEADFIPFVKGMTQRD